MTLRKRYVSSLCLSSSYPLWIEIAGFLTRVALSMGVSKRPNLGPLVALIGLCCCLVLALISLWIQSRHWAAYGVEAGGTVPRRDGNSQSLAESLKAVAVPTLKPADLLTFAALPSYGEPQWVRSQFVDTGLLPALKDRLPKEPMVYLPAAMSSGIGTYGDVIRHVTGGRPEGWNYSAGQSQGWGGVDITLNECLTRTGPLFRVARADLAPLPNLARSWSWSSNGLTLDMKLIEGARWSDGHPFTSDDIMFYWVHNVLDPNVSPLNGANNDSFGIGTKLEATGPYSLRWTFTTPFPVDSLYQMAYGKFCPGPAHILRPQHPAFNKDNSYDDYKNAFPATMVNFPTMGAWVVTQYRPDDIIIMRRNPFFWKVDAKGQQLPYLDEVQFRLLGWGDREVQVVAGGSDLANMETPASFIEVLRQAAKPNAAFRVAFGAPNTAFSINMNLSGNGWGEPDARAQAIRTLNRTLDFRRAVSLAIDRELLGKALVKGPLIRPYFGGILSGTPFYNAEATVRFEHNRDQAAALLAGIGLKDTDGDGYLNHRPEILNGANVEIVLTASADVVTDRSLAEAIMIFAKDIGLRVILRYMGGTQRDAITASGQFDWMLARNSTTELVTVVQGSDALAPMAPYSHAFHRAGPDGRLDLMPYEATMIEQVKAFSNTTNQSQRISIMAQYQRTSTENVNAVGLVQFPGALMIDKRFANVAPGVPVLMFNWAEDALMRELLFVPEGRRSRFELRPQTLPPCVYCTSNRGVRS